MLISGGRGAETYAGFYLSIYLKNVAHTMNLVKKSNDCMFKLVIPHN